MEKYNFVFVFSLLSKTIRNAMVDKITHIGADSMFSDSPAKNISFAF